MCLKDILNLLKSFQGTTVTLPHPEEKQDPSKTAANTDIQAVLQKWLADWKVPAVQWDYWKTAIEVTVYDQWPQDKLALGIKAGTPAYATETPSGRALFSLASWYNPGVVAHEQAHNSYALLTESEKAEFEEVYLPLAATDQYITLLHSQNTYMDTIQEGTNRHVEGHAEVYRYIGDKMPSTLKRFYPRLF